MIEESEGGRRRSRLGTGSTLARRAGIAIATLLLTTRVRSQEFLWARQIAGTSGDERIFAVATDARHAVYAVGYFTGTADFDPGPGTYTLTSVGYDDMFVSKLDAAGQFVWAGALSGTAAASAYAVVATGASVFVTGSFQGTVDFDPSPSTTYNLTAGLNARDVFVLQLDLDGRFVRALQFKGNQSAGSGAIAADADGNVYAAGYFQGTVDFDPDPVGVHQLTSVPVAGYNIFLAKLGPGGNLLWVAQMGGSGGDMARGLAVDASGNVYTTGGFYGTGDFDPGPGVFNLSAVGVNYADAFVSKLDASGQFVWAKRLGGAGRDSGNAIAVDGSGNVVTTGDFEGVSDFDPDPGVTYELTSAGDYDVYVSKLGPSGEFVWAGSFAGVNEAHAYGIALDRAGNVYSTGSYVASADFDPGPGTATRPAGFRDVYLSKLGADGQFLSAINLGGTSDDGGESLAVDDDGSVVAAGYFKGTADFAPGGPSFTLTSVSSTNASDAFVAKYVQTPAIAFTDRTSLAWRALFGETAYDVYRSDSVLPGTFVCLASRTSDPSVIDLEEPAGDSLFAYLVTTVTVSDVEGDLGYETANGIPVAVRPNPSPCP